MIFTNTISLLLALAPAAIFAAPTKTGSISDIKLTAQQIKLVTNGACDVAGLSMPVAPTPLPAPGAGLKVSHVAIGRGTQNYTCATNTKDSVPVLYGANAFLYNATCNAVHYPDLFTMYSTYAMSETAPYKSDVAKLLLSGHHEFTAAGSPYFNLDSNNGQFGYIVAKKNGTSNAPATKDVPWLKLTATDGDFKEVYRLNTLDGQAPATCEGQASTIFVQYAAVYWFWK
ncbi:hypothetical protein BDV96DRAFT_610077 [Lophiotrema nucula]|uniref:Malate dehydrogenase n=1 Tax=Lophiotrema nucula TaxID=690887 RepID=A0A6A5ZKN9_9PLEO|nr:hypothetical protein BDV96DRAFT_610077 [Lophiotrema nucula]